LSRRRQSPRFSHPFASHGGGIAARVACIAVLVSLLSACGSGGGTPSPGETATPAPSVNATPGGTPVDSPTADLKVVEFALPAGTGPHDVAPAPDGRVWYTAQRTGELGVLDPRTGATHQISLGEGSAPHGVVVGPDGAPWVTDGGLNAIVRVDPLTEQVRVFPLPADRPSANLNTATFDKNGDLWFTGQAGVYGKLDTESGKIEVFDAPGGPGPYGIATTPSGDVYFASLAGNYVGHIDVITGTATRLNALSPGQGARRVWSDSGGRIWISEWNAGKLALYDPSTLHWQEWRMPGSHPMAYAVFVDDQDIVWLSDFGSNAIVRYDPKTERFTTLPLPSANGSVRQLLGRTGEVWGAESGADKLILIRTRDNRSQGLEPGR
jgi:virginiamycin B lyase